MYLLSTEESNNKLNPRSTTTRPDLLPRFAHAAGHHPLRQLRDPSFAQLNLQMVRIHTVHLMYNYTISGNTSNVMLCIIETRTRLFLN